ncbi:endonuclease/exonuclease/phosphatase family protein [Yoonia sp. F2084L]|uniref:endonuclease/exonuclease/phosphatase family protein n=1 Tax=Yoonia sp. F2084L TaxID=2926419 RepID=UPI001FF5C211|nr:endonuclease/exonuclease/phosphatase family protein [Yoonia sp. F2084L]MCK0096621.1 endonuclease/exonuclease/phosphatase family protein [Yoonia sp. F2084L]
MIVTIMKAFGAILLTLLTLVGCQTIRNSGNMPLLAPTAQTLRIATYNVHYIILERDTGAWSVGDWERRKTPLDQAFKAVQADVIGFQEMESFGRGSGGRINLTLDWLLENNPDYAAAAVGDPAVFPSTQPILYRSDRLTVLDQGWFFFSDTPDVIYSRTFNGSFPAFTSWAQFRDDNSGEVFRVVNLHTDFGSRSNRIQSIELVAERTAPWIADNETLFVIGDFNGRIGDTVVDILAEAGLDFAPVQGSTFHFNRGINLFGAIDHIASSGNTQLVGPPIVLRQKFAGEWPTDHYPVIADYRLGQ